MADMNNYAEISFTNPIFIDIFSRYADNSVMAELVSESGEIVLKFRMNSPADPPTCCEHVLSLIYALMESNPDTRIGRVYAENQTNILRETVYRLAQVLDGFSSVKLSIVTDGQNGESAAKRTEFTLTRSKNTSRQ